MGAPFAFRSEVILTPQCKRQTAFDELYGLTGCVIGFPYVERVELFNLGLKPSEPLTSTTGFDVRE
jgi:hypothetical protein